MSNWLGIIIVVTYIFALIGAAELLRRRWDLDSSFTRKVIHIGVGMLSWTLPFLFSDPWPFVAGALGFAALTYFDWRYQFLKAMASSDRNNLGTVYFPLVAAMIVVFFWERPPLMVAALMPLTWGDGLAPIVGNKYGRHYYQIKNSVRTVEGSLGFFAGAFISTWLALWLMPGFPDLLPLTALLPALMVALLTTLIEAISIKGLDNITITLAAAAVLAFWPF